MLVRDDPRKRDGVDVHCFAGCDWRDVKAVLVSLGLLEGFKPELGNPITRPALEQDDGQSLKRALHIWRTAVPLNGTLGWRYFTERRGVHVSALELDHCLRWHDDLKAVVALMTDAVSNEPCGVHQIFLNPDGAKRERMMLGRQGVVRLSADEDVLAGLGITEGIEDALAVLANGWSPVWAATSAGAIVGLPVLRGVEALTIFRDDDDAGHAAAQACAQRWSAAGREVFLTWLT